MSDKPFSPELKHYKSSIKIAPKQPTLGLTQRITTSILSNKFSQASQLCKQYQNLPLKKITDLCYEYYLLKYVINDEKIIDNQGKFIGSYQMTKQLELLLQRTIQYKTVWLNSKKYFQEIDNAIREICIRDKFDPRIVSGNNEYLQKIKQSLFQAHSTVLKLKQKQKELNNSINHLNLVYNKTKILFQQQKKANILTFRQKTRLIQQTKARNLELQQKLRDKQEFEEQLSKKRQMEFLRLQGQTKQLKIMLNELSHQKQNLIKELSQAKIQNQRIAKQTRQISVYQKNHDKQRKDYLSKISQKKATISNLISELESTNQMIADLQEAQRSRENIVKELRNKNDELQLNCQTLKTSIQQLKANNQQLRLASEEKATEIQDLAAEKHQLQLKCQQLKKQINEHFTAHQTQTSNISQLQEEKQELKQNLATQQAQKYNLQHKIEEFQTQVFHYQTVNYRLQERIRQLEAQTDKFNQHIDSLNLQLLRLTQDFQNLQNQNFNHSCKGQPECIDECCNTVLSLEDLNHIQNKVIDDQQTINKYREKTEALEIALVHQEQQKEQLRSKYVQFQAKYLTLLKQVDLAQIQRTALFFNGRILDEEPQARKYLQQAIETTERRKIRKTTLLYQLQTLNKVNVHKYIDKVHNIVLVVKTEAGWLVGAYSQGPFYPKMISDKNGVIVSISDRSFYELKVANKRAIAYDDFFVIFGNSQVRIKTQEYKLFSNFGISSSYYDHKQQKVEVITGQSGVREVAILGFQFFQVEFY